MFNQEINTIEDVRQFFLYLVNKRMLNFHPDMDFSDYVSIETGKSTFTEEEINHFNKLMDASFDICDSENIDIYEMGLEILKETLEA